jgi:chromosome segregation protein
MAVVIWKRLILRGFGRYQGEVDLQLNDMVNILNAPNEAGKSTLVAGLAAVLFGLPGCNDPDRFGQARYRNWDGPEKFSGELWFAADDVDYHLQREFETHQVTLRRFSGGRWREVSGACGTHNPDARRKLQGYEDMLHRLLGLSSREVFQATFCLTQPLPEPDELDANVQGLLSGSGRKTADVQEHLARQVKAITRRYAEPLAQRRDGIKNRELEDLEEEIAALKARIESSRSAADELQAVQAELQELSERHQEQQQLHAQRERLLGAFRDWRFHQERYQLNLEQQQKLEQALSRCRQLSAQIEQLDQSLLQYADLDAAPVDWPDLLEQLAQLERGRQELQTDIQQTEQELAECNALMEQLRQELMAFPAVYAQASLLADHARLLQQRQRLAELSSAVSELEERQAEIAAALQQLPDFSRLGRQPASSLRELRRELGAAAADYQVWVRRRTELQQQEQELSENYSLLDQADAATVQQLADYRRLCLELETAEREARRTHRQLREKEDAYLLAEEIYQKQYGALVGPPEPMLEAIDQQIKLLGGRRSRQQQAGARRLPWAVAGGLALLGAILCFVFWGRDNGTTGALVSSGLGIFLTLVLRLIPAGSQPAAVSSPELGRAAGLSLPELIEMRSVLERLRQALAQRPAAADLAQAENSWQQAREALGSWQEATAAYAAAYADPERAAESWQQGRQACQRLQQELDTLQERLGFDPAAADALPQLVARLELDEFLGLLGRQLAEFAGLDDFLAAFSAVAPLWDDLLGQAVTWEELSEEKGHLARQLQQLTKPDQTGETEEARLEAAVARLSSQLGAEISALSAAELQQRYDEYDDLSDRLRVASTHQQRAAALLRQRQESLAQLEQQRGELLQPIAAIWQAAGADLAVLRQRYAAYSQLKDQRRNAEQARQEVLSLHNSDSLAQLEVASLKLRNDAAAIHIRWQELIDGHPGLPPMSAAGKPQQVEDQYRQIADEVARLSAELTRLRQREAALTTQQARLLGQEPINVAQAEGQLQQLLARRDRLQLEVEALGVAYRELAEAKRDYEATYRERLAQQVSQYFDLITGGQGRAVELGEDFQVSVLTADGKPVSPGQLSQGARDQLYLSLRLGIADLLAEDASLPFLLDDPFVNCDAERLERIRQALASTGQQRQIWLLTHERRLADWGTPVQLSVTE